jgi:acyl-CoA dehydrogenase
MPDRSFLSWPFLEATHRAHAERLEGWAAAHLAALDHEDADATCNALVRRLGAEGWLAGIVAARPDVRALCLSREILARHDPLADFAFAMQGLGGVPIAAHGTQALKDRFLPPVIAGDAIAAFAMSEPEGGSDVAALRTTARAEGASYVLDGVKTWISNAGIAAHYVVLARTGEAPGARGLSAFVVAADAPGLRVRERIATIAPHPLGTLEFDACRVPAAQLLGKPGDGFKIAMATLDIFRGSVGAAALGMARRAFDETLARVRAREVFASKLAEFQLTQAKLADMACAIDAAALLIYRAAWTKDTQAERVTREASMAKLQATEMAQRVIDEAVQLHGALGVTAGHPVERLYREIRALRLYEGTSEIQRLVIAGQVLRDAP